MGAEDSPGPVRNEAGDEFEVTSDKIIPASLASCSARRKAPGQYTHRALHGEMA